ncbi:HU family DNA-binding protein [Manganibacter manganicus]|uniref:HU family DNA-binding protein n=1 Tax=Manganibacter manganicus TaxID=1873176 RepID=UPI003CC93E24
MSFIRRPLCFVIYTASPWHVTTPLGEDGNHPICQATSEQDGRNPSTGATIKIAASKKLTFTPAKAIKDALNG